MSAFEVLIDNYSVVVVWCVWSGKLGERGGGKGRGEE